MQAKSEALLEKVRAAPRQPGCYIYHDGNGYVIYVGKAKNLSNRVKSYFTKAAAEDERTAKLVRQIADVEYITAETELDALLLEYQLIKQHKPWFNSQLKPDKPRPYIRVSTDAPYPCLTIEQERTDDGAAYYGFFKDEYTARDAISVIGRAWGLPQCRSRSFSKKRSPCSYRSLDGCMAPCGHKPEQAEYASALHELGEFFNGSTAILDKLALRMQEHAGQLAFEKAAAAKGLMLALTALQYRSRRRVPEKGAALAMLRPYRAVDFSAFFMVDGLVLSRADFPEGSCYADYRAYAKTLSLRAEPLPDSAWMADCFAEITAERMIIPLEQAFKRQVAGALKEFAATRK